MTKSENQRRMNQESEWLFLQARHRLTTHTNAQGARLTANEKAEGKDITSNCFLPTFRRSAEETADLFFHPYDEVKAVNGLLRKDNTYNHSETSGTLPIEIFINWSDHADSWYPYAGWLLALYNPELYSRIKTAHNAPDQVYTPSTLAFVLYDGATLGEEKPFACITFEDIQRLKDRIRDCLPAEWDLDKWDIPPLSERGYWSRYIDFDNHGYSAKWNLANGGMIQNCWHIPLRRLLDIATVTMIGESDPMIGAWTPDQYDLQKARLEYIKSYAWNLDAEYNWKERRITEAQIRRELEEAHGRTPAKYGEIYYTDIREYRRAQNECLRYRA